MKTVRFVKMHGAGNDFVLVDDRDGGFPCEHRLIAAMATRPSGIGCEGVILVQRSDMADFKMRFFNPDGSEAVDGLKTGYIDAGGSSVVLTGRRGGKRAIAIVLGSASSNERDDNAARLLADALGAIAW